MHVCCAESKHTWPAWRWYHVITHLKADASGQCACQGRHSRPTGRPRPFCHASEHQYVWLVLFSPLIIMPRRVTSKMRHIATDGVAWIRGADCQCLVRSVSPAKNGSTDRDPLWDVDLGGPKEPCIRWGPDPHMWRGSFDGEKDRPRTWPDMSDGRGTEGDSAMSAQVQCRHQLRCIGGVHIGATWRVR